MTLNKSWLMFALIALLVAVTGCTAPAPTAADSSNNAETDVQTTNSDSSPAASSSDVKLTAYTAVVGGKNPDEEKLFMQEIERLTGLDIDMIKPPGSEYDQKLVTALSSGEVIDLVYMTTPVFERLYSQGLLAPLTQCIENSPVLSDPEIIDPAEWERIRRDDGEIYGVFNKNEGGILPIVRCDWMEKLGIEPPQTLDDYRSMYEAFATQDPDGNGKDDTYGLTLAGLYDIQPFMGTQGLKYGYVEGADGCLDVPWASDEAIPVYEWLHQLYADGLIDPNFATNNTGNSRELIFSDQAGSMNYWAAWVGLFNEQVKAEDPNAEFRMCGIEPPKGANGEAMLRAGDDGFWAVDVDSQHKDEACKFLEFWHTEEGNVLGTLGILDNDYTLTDGTYELTQVGKEHAMDHGAPYPKSLQWVNPIGTPEGVEEANAIVATYAERQLPNDTAQLAMDIVSQLGVRAVLGEITSADAVAEMQTRLRDRGYLTCE